jgi:hypothetical protein
MYAAYDYRDILRDAPVQRRYFLGNNPCHAVASVPDLGHLRLDGNTVVFSRFKAGKLIQMGIIVVSQDGKSRTNTTSGIIGPNGLAGTTVSFYDKQ